MTDCAPLKVSQIAAAIEQVAPLRLQENYDNAGLQVGNPEMNVSGVLLCTDITPAVLDEAIARGMNMVISHHPLIFGGLKHITGATYIERVITRAIKHDIALYCAHTNMDSAAGGVSWRMADKLSLTDVEPLDPNPEHPTAGLGVVGNIKPTTGNELLQDVKRAFRCASVRYSGATQTAVTRVALCGGSGAFLIDKAQRAGAQAFITGEMKYHDFARAYEGILLADIGHYESEQYTKEIFREIIQQLKPHFTVDFAREEANQIHYL